VAAAVNDKTGLLWEGSKRCAALPGVSGPAGEPDGLPRFDQSILLAATIANAHGRFTIPI